MMTRPYDLSSLFFPMRIEILEDIECSLFLSLVGNQSLSIEEVLDPR